MHFGRIFTLATGLAVGSMMTTANAKEPMSLGILLFPGHQPLDVWGPLDIFSSLSRSRNISLALIAKEVGPVSSKSPPRLNPPPNMNMMPVTMDPSIVATHTPATAPRLDVLLIPGGGGNRVLADYNDTWMEEFVVARYPQLEYLLSVCTGAVTIANSGLLEGKKATSNKRSWAWVIEHGKNVSWVPTARWVVDGNIWTSSGVAAGMDMTYAFLKHYYGPEDKGPSDTLNNIEYAPHIDPHWDPFSIVHNVTGADRTSSLTDCVKPAGY